MIQLIDPKKRILRNVKAEHLNQMDYKAINAYISKRGATVLSITNEEGGLGISDQENLLQNQKIKNEIAYLIKGLKSKKRL